ncbi:MAG: DUF4011 domain-containing protein [Deltaproteobacteria bacterium]|nr:MAG: DUF4011 domain-containing protein [Deltaproteobacteria bacterium]
MTTEQSFLDWLREAREGEGRGNEELLRAMLPLLEQLQAAHDEGLVGPLDGVGRILIDDGRLWFHRNEARSPTLAVEELRRVERRRSEGLDVVGGGYVEIEWGVQHSRRTDQRRGEDPIEQPVFIPGFTSWEQEVGHHDALTDVFAAGMVFASLAIGADFTEPDELQRFVTHRHTLTRLNSGLHPVLARAIVRMTEPDRHRRAQDLPSLIDRLRRYRDVDERNDTDLDFQAIEGFQTADKDSRRHLIQRALQSRLFDLSRRNRMIWYRPTQRQLDLTMASVPIQLNAEAISAQDLLLWEGPVGEALRQGRPVRLDRFLRFEDHPWARSTLDTIRSEDRRARNEVGFSQLRLVIAFLNWHDLRERDGEERIRSPLLLLPVALTLERGVRDTYVLSPISEFAEVNPALRHRLQQLYGLDLPEQIDLSKAEVSTFQKALAAAIQRSEPAVTVHLITRPQIRILRETARRRLNAWRRRSRSSGRGLRTALGVSFSYSRSNFQPLGLALYREKVQAETYGFEEHLRDAQPILPPSGAAEGQPQGAPPSDERVSTRQVWHEEEVAAGPYDWAVDLTHLTLGAFNYRKMSLVADYDRMLADDSDHDHPSFDRLFSLDARELGSPPEPEGEGLDLFTVVSADPTQAAAVRWARTGQSFIIQGPPGTGKSQTITNLIADFAARGQRVLFVCQKRVALDVVYHRLAQHGLDELCVLIHDSQADKRPFIDDLKRTYTGWTTPDLSGENEPLRDEVVERMQDSLGRLRRFARGMAAPAKGSELRVIDVIDRRIAQGAPPALSAAEAEWVPAHRDWAQGRAAVHELGGLLAEQVGDSSLSATPLIHLAAEVLNAPRPVHVLRERLDRVRGLLIQVHTAGEKVREGATRADLADALALARTLRPLLPDNLALLDPESARSLRLLELVQAHERAQAALAQAQTATAPWTQKLPRADVGTALSQARWLDGLFFLFRWLAPAWWQLRGVLRSRYAFDQHAVKPTWTGVLEALELEYARQDELESIAQQTRDLLGVERTPPELLAMVERLRRDRGRTALQRELVHRWRASPHDATTILRAEASVEALNTATAALFDRSEGLGLERLETLLSEVEASIDHLPTLQGALRRLATTPPAVRDAVRALPLRPVDFDAAVLQRTLDLSFAEDRELGTFDAGQLRGRAIELHHAQHALLALNARVVRERVRARFRERLHLSTLPHGELTEPEKAIKRVYNAGRRVLEREFEKVMRHRSIRDLSEGDSGTVVYDLKPIWLMSPLSISDAIPLDEQRFDVVIFDEASQIPLEEAVPAVYRAPQMIVVGDQMQLPPTNFFASGGGDGASEDEPGDIHYDLEAESFLSHAARCLPTTMLGWHYRSRHEALIQFSNQAFYHGELLTVPDRLRGVEREPIVVNEPNEGDEYATAVLDRPLTYHRMERSPYVKRSNPGEADYIARLVRGLLAAPERPTIGIVAFSEAQQSTIESALAALGGEDPAFQRALDAELEREEDGQQVGLFVKNLENVQGDERDVIVLSVCYGPDPNGKMRMNFGPINKGGGEKRLNVVFSRAREHMAVVASIEHTAITNQYNDGALCLRRYLHYAEACSRGDARTAATVLHTLRRGGRDPAKEVPSWIILDSLVDALEDEGLVVVRDLGSSGFRVDVAVGRDDEDALRVAVLVDAPRLGDDHQPLEAWHQRPAVLRAFGWTVVPVLARAWLEDPDAVLARILWALEEPEAFALPDPGEPPDPKAVEAPTEPSDDPSALSIPGSTIVFTGALQRWNRDEVTSLVVALGGRPAKAVSRRTAFVVSGARPGTILEDATERGIPVIDEQAFAALVEAAKPSIKRLARREGSDP